MLVFTHKIRVHAVQLYMSESIRVARALAANGLVREQRIDEENGELRTRNYMNFQSSDRGCCRSSSNRY